MSDSRYGIPAETKIGMPPVSRPPALNRAQLIWVARAAARILANGAPNTAAVCAAYLREVEENARLRERLAAAQGWGEEQTKRQEQPTQAELAARCATRTGIHKIPGARR